ncbi:hypothetical protein BX661DRAFT_168983 [Kickxella alabastrina]|uniref:uncharacterized protein n=1 Tax=Kickxella alabastrina TaxID=61397 RepID=UPI00221FA905|nr:uncharacterized protein BX661DRAFT_168983 [Kickxella alabastrina]KAI7833865.1 hypothetical protein BX661DRAFT_168983 [Kickxella alabastrina]
MREAERLECRPSPIAPGPLFMEPAPSPLPSPSISMSMSMSMSISGDSSLDDRSRSDSGEVDIDRWVEYADDCGGFGAGAGSGSEADDDAVAVADSGSGSGTDAGAGAGVDIAARDVGCVSSQCLKDVDARAKGGNAKLLGQHGVGHIMPGAVFVCVGACGRGCGCGCDCDCIWAGLCANGAAAADGSGRDVVILLIECRALLLGKNGSGSGRAIPSANDRVIAKENPPLSAFLGLWIGRFGIASHARLGPVQLASTAGSDGRTTAAKTLLARASLLPRRSRSNL